MAAGAGVALGGLILKLKFSAYSFKEWARVNEHQKLSKLGTAMFKIADFTDEHRLIAWLGGGMALEGLLDSDLIDNLLSGKGKGGGPAAEQPASEAPAAEQPGAPAEPNGEPPKNTMWPPREPVVDADPGAIDPDKTIGPAENPNPNPDLGTDVPPGGLVELPDGGYSIDGVTFDAPKPYDHEHIWGDAMQNTDNTDGFQAGVNKWSEVGAGEIPSGQGADPLKDFMAYGLNDHLPQDVIDNPKGTPMIRLDNLTTFKQLEQLQDAGDGKFLLMPSEAQQDRLAAFAAEALKAENPNPAQQLFQDMNGSFGERLGNPLLGQDLTDDQVQMLIDVMNGKVK